MYLSTILAHVFMYLSTELSIWVLLNYVLDHVFKQEIYYLSK